MEFVTTNARISKPRVRGPNPLGRANKSNIFANLRSLFYYLIMKKGKPSIKGPKTNKIGLRSSVSVYKTEFSKHKKMQFYNINKIANNLAKHFKRLKPFKF